eukprot:1194966-Prorocentrum_minimum.AAC.3
MAASAAPTCAATPRAAPPSPLARRAARSSASRAASASWRRSSPATSASPIRPSASTEKVSCGGAVSRAVSGPAPPRR